MTKKVWTSSKLNRKVLSVFEVIFPKNITSAFIFVTYILYYIYRVYTCIMYRSTFDFSTATCILLFLKFYKQMKFYSWAKCLWRKFRTRWNNDVLVSFKFLLTHTVHMRSNAVFACDPDKKLLCRLQYIIIINLYSIFQYLYCCRVVVNPPRWLKEG